MFIDPQWTDIDTLTYFFTDVSGTSGYGAYFDRSWFRGSWSPHQELSQRSIQWQEHLAIVAAAKLWGHSPSKKPDSVSLRQSRTAGGRGGVGECNGS